MGVSKTQFWLWNLLIALLYYAFAAVGLAYAFDHTSVSPVWPATGFALAAIFLLGTKVLPGIFLGAFVANLFHGCPLWVAAGIGIGNSLEAWVGGRLVARATRGRNFLLSAKDFFAFVMYAGLFGTAVSATIGSLMLYLAADSSVTGSQVANWWLTWWLGDMGGAFTAAPLIFAWTRLPSLNWSKKQSAEFLLMCLGMILVARFTFGPWTLLLGFNRVSFLIVPFLIWACFRFGARGVTTAIVLMSMIAVSGTLRGYGPFANINPTHSLMLLQCFVNLMSVTFLSSSTLLSERDAVAKELARSNRELERFAYLASHDLQEPLRTIHSFSQKIERDYAGVLDPKGDEYLKLILSAARRMHELIRDLLEYSRMGQRVSLQPTDSSVAFDQAVANLEASITESDASVRRERLPIVLADPTLLVMLFQNLIGNAIKFRGDLKPVVEVSSEIFGKQWIFTVKDNGIGIEREYQNKVFQLFQRIHSREQYAGTGVGLAVCKKIVEFAGGQIWVESEAGHGAAFRFTVPLAS